MTKEKLLEAIQYGLKQVSADIKDWPDDFKHLTDQDRDNIDEMADNPIKINCKPAKILQMESLTALSPKIQDSLKNFTENRDDTFHRAWETSLKLAQITLGVPIRLFEYYESEDYDLYNNLVQIYFEPPGELSRTKYFSFDQIMKELKEAFEPTSLIPSISTVEYLREAGKSHCITLTF